MWPAASGAQPVADSADSDTQRAVSGGTDTARARAASVMSTTLMQRRAIMSDVDSYVTNAVTR
jgi:hypothetical protein